MNNEDKIWLEQTFPQYYGRTIKGEVYRAYLKAEQIFNGAAKLNERGCSCQYRSLKNEVDLKYNKWLQSNGKT